jgi:hypothetical protein
VKNQEINKGLCKWDQKTKKSQTEKQRIEHQRNPSHNSCRNPTGNEKSEFFLCFSITPFLNSIVSVNICMLSLWYRSIRSLVRNLLTSFVPAGALIIRWVVASIVFLACSIDIFQFFASHSAVTPLLLLLVAIPDIAIHWRPWNRSHSSRVLLTDDRVSVVCEQILAPMTCRRFKVTSLIQECFWTKSLDVRSPVTFKRQENNNSPQLHLNCRGCHHHVRLFPSVYCCYSSDTPPPPIGYHQRYQSEWS